MPDSMIVVDTSTSASPARNACIRSSSSRSRHLAVRDEEAKAGTELLELLARLVDRLDPVVQVERLPAARVLALERGLDELLVVLADGRPDRAPPGGGVSMIEMSRSPESDMCSVRGIGVADSARTSTSSRSERRSSFCATPKRCSSSRTTSPRFFGMTSRERTRCVPIRTSTFPSRNSARICFWSARDAGSATPSRPAPGSRDSAHGTCSSAAPRGSSSGRERASACR